jgi:hypothetical protein
VPFLVGIITLLNQFHANVTTTFFAYIGQYIRCIVASYVEKYAALISTSDLSLILRNIGKVDRYPDDINKMLIFLNQFCAYSGTPKSEVEQFVPQYIFAAYTIPSAPAK